MTVSYSLNVRQDKLNVVSSRFGNAGILTFYSGTRPSTGGALSNNTMLVTFTLGTPFAPSANGTIGSVVSISPNLPAITTATGGGAGLTATWARGADSSGTFVADFDVGAAGSGADIQLATTTISTGLSVQITAWQIFTGNA